MYTRTITYLIPYTCKHCNPETRGAFENSSHLKHPHEHVNASGPQGWTLFIDCCFQRMPKLFRWNPEYRDRKVRTVNAGIMGPRGHARGIIDRTIKRLNEWITNRFKKQSENTCSHGGVVRCGFFHIPPSNLLLQEFHSFCCILIKYLHKIFNTPPLTCKYFSFLCLWKFVSAEKFLKN
jgi:hypothetical protein